MLTLDLVRKKEGQAKNSDMRQATCLGEAESEAIHQACGKEPGFEGKQDLKGVCTGRSLQAEGMV